MMCDVLQSPHCVLRLLLLNGCRIDDDGCATLVKGLKGHRHLATLGLAKNEFGHNEVSSISEL